MTVNLRTYVWTNSRGAITLSVVLILIYLLERGVAALLGFPDEIVMLSTLVVEQKRLLAAIVGPLLHRGVPHISQNLLFLLLFGGYVEWVVGWRRLYAYSAVTGYVSTWLLLFAGNAGAVGASSITNGLQAIAGFVGLVRFIKGMSTTEDFTDLLITVLNVIPLFFGLLFAYDSIRIGMMSSTGGTQAIHALAAVVGGFLGVLYVLEQFTIRTD
jgi:membrane associated rhomboid family serine protease